MTYMGQAQNDSWGGIFLATSDCAIGCPWRKHGVVIGCGNDEAHTSGADPLVCGGPIGSTPVSKQKPIHEHDLIMLPNGTYAVFCESPPLTSTSTVVFNLCCSYVAACSIAYLNEKWFGAADAGNTAPGDQGFVATSQDLIHWSNYAGNPVLPLPLKECGSYPHSTCWDGEHRRPRSVFQYCELQY